MGAALSSNISSQIIDTSFAIANQYVQKCGTNVSQDFNLDIGKDCTANLGTININQNQLVNVACLQNNTTKTSMQSDIKAQILQQTTAAAQSIGLPSLSFAQSYEDFAQSTSETISTTVSQTCTSNLNQAQKISCAAGSNLTIGIINITDEQNSLANCISTNVSIEQLKGNLSNTIYSTTNAKEVDTAVTFVIIGLIILTFVGIFFLYTINGPIGWVIVGIFLLVVIAIIVYGAVAFSDKLYPFNQQTALG